MTRPTRFVLVMSSLLCFVFAAPAASEAGLIPWTYNAIFGPVGSMRYGRGTYAYAPTSYGYAPTAYASYPVASSYGGGGGCSTCNQSSYYPPVASYDAFYGSYSSYGCSCQPCCNCTTGNCSTGNCSSGTCTNCNANTSPPNGGTGSGAMGQGSNTSSYGPIPDPDNTRNVNTRLIEIENRVSRDEHRWNEIERFLKRFEGFQPFSGSSGSEVVPPRHKSTMESGDPDFQSPRSKRPATGGDPIEGESRKPELPAPDIDGKSNSQEKSDQEKEQPATFKESEPQTLRLQDRLTTQAIAPRERMQIVTKNGKMAIAKSSKPQTAIQTSEQPRLPELARK